MQAEQDDWGKWPFVLNEKALAVLRAAIEETPLIVEHRFYRGSRAPQQLVFDEFEALEEHLRATSAPGDSIWVWRYSHVCRNDNALVWGKIPDEAGRVPKRGAY